MRRLRANRGQAAVEFAVLFPIILALLIFLVEFGFMFYSYVTVNNTASEAARFAAVGRPSLGCSGGASANSIEARAIEVSNGMVDCDDVTVGYLDPDGNSAPNYSRGDQVIVRITYDYQTVTPVGALLSMASFGSFPTTFEMAACSDARLEGPILDGGSTAAASGSCD